MKLPIPRIPAILFPALFLPLAACVATTTHLYRGEMELVSVSGEACSEKTTIGSHIPLELALERSSSFGTLLVTGYFSGPEIQTGHFTGNDISRLLVNYPDETGLTAQGHLLALSPTPDGMSGELREKAPAASSGCYFEKATVTLKTVATGNVAKGVLDRQVKLFSAGELYSKGQALLKANNPDEALRNLTYSLKLRNEVDPHDPDRANAAIAIATADVMAGRENEAISFLRNMLTEKSDPIPAMLKLRMGVSGGLCADTLETGENEQQKASQQLLDTVAREFGGLGGVGPILVDCYRELGQERLEQDEPDQSIKYFLKALTLNPDDTDSIAGVVIANIAKDTPADGRRFLQEHIRIIMDKAGRESYNGSLSFLYAAEAKQAEKGGDYARAEQLLREALKILPGERVCIINLAGLLGKTSRPGEARQLLEEARKGCGDETCRLEYAAELARLEQIERMVKRLEQNR